MTPTTSARLDDLKSLNATDLDYTHLRHHARVPLTSATAAIAQAPDASPRVLNISRGGLLLDGPRLAPGLTVDVTLHSHELHGAGAGCVIHSRHGLTGIAVQRWDDALDAAIDELVKHALLARSTWRELYDGLPGAGSIEPRPMQRGRAERRAILQ